jgi:hypothetical protein
MVLEVSCAWSRMARPQPGQWAVTVGCSGEACAAEDDAASSGSTPGRGSRESRIANPQAGQFAFLPRYFSLTLMERPHDGQGTETFLSACLAVFTGVDSGSGGSGLEAKEPGAIMI